ncbi:MAG: dienelactone hydrolase family protein [Patescibacteria group bacterium]|nr:dienelactone hydrolase family protein [Patescibacteria group bacterium]
MEKIFLTTDDSIKIAADLYPVEKPIGWLILTHMMPATKESFNDFAMEAQKNGYESVAIDLRGHGESNSGPEGFFKFSNEEHQKSILDLKAAVDYLIKERNATPDKISFIGASIGANLSLQHIAENPEYKTAILLSPGLNYRGLKTEPLIKKLQPKQKILFVSAEDDGPNAEENRLLFEAVPDKINKQIKIYETGGHGTDILKNQPELKNLIFEFLK